MESSGSCRCPWCWLQKDSKPLERVSRDQQRVCTHHTWPESRTRAIPARTSLRRGENHRPDLLLKRRTWGLEAGPPPLSAGRLKSGKKYQRMSEAGLWTHALNAGCTEGAAGADSVAPLLTYRNRICLIKPEEGKWHHCTDPHTLPFTPHYKTTGTHVHRIYPHTSLPAQREEIYWLTTDYRTNVPVPLLLIPVEFSLFKASCY